MNLKDYLRIQFSDIRKNKIGDKCEFCGSKNGLNLHHNKQFSEILSEILSELNLKLQEVDQYSESDLEKINFLNLKKHNEIGYTTLCSTCHRKLHGDNYMKYNYNNELDMAYTKINNIELMFNTDENNYFVDDYFMNNYVGYIDISFIIFINRFSGRFKTITNIKDIVSESLYIPNSRENKINSKYFDVINKYYNIGMLDNVDVNKDSIKFTYVSLNKRKVLFTNDIYNKIIKMEISNKCKIRLLSVLWILCIYKTNESIFNYTNFLWYTKEKLNISISLIIKTLSELQEYNIIKFIK